MLTTEALIADIKEGTKGACAGGGAPGAGGMYQVFQLARNLNPKKGVHGASRDAIFFFADPSPLACYSG